MYRVIPFKVGECYNEGPRVFYLGDCRRKINLYNIFWLIKGQRERVLVDTGFDKGFAAGHMPDIKQHHDENPIIQLQRVGVHSDDITKIILTHSHFDHLSPTVFEFKNAQVYIQQRELDCVLNPVHPWFREFIDIETIIKLRDQGRFIVISGDVDICPGIKAILTGGHSPGHQSIIVKTHKGSIILTGDIAFTYENINNDIPVGFNYNLEECLLAMKRIRNMGYKIIPGHDPKVFDEEWF
ncbi:MAG: N-acyl homoserine lactonase family protein [Mahellales bacterium]|jgi:glyoxylase-like metal-dependent hydrolase (beta-lactamase superfamily II)